ncbi:ribosome maturation factor RimP [Helicobacter trogontum]|uniref:ribosome maturation factor RimP n=1 Tax=Helicobacter trogontum TaxID=50960 RepID=UPI000CF04D7C|nr:ribosome maturation factor RimP [Helicobacter trogontum]
MITKDLHDKIEALITQKGIELYDIELLKENENMILRISIFKKDGVSLDDCENVSALIAPLLDVELTSLEAYHLEVSSPGIERNLKKPKHFLCSIGQQVAVTLSDKTTIVGILESYNTEEITIKEILKPTKKKQQTPQDTRTHVIRLDECKKVKTIFDWKSYALKE